MIKPGTYNAKVLSHAISATKDGSPQAAITFSFDADGPKTLTYFGSFKGGAMEYTLKALLNCGLRGNNPAGPLEIGKEVSIVVSDEEGQDGKVRTKINWVNKFGGVKNVIAPDLAKAKLADLEGYVMAARQEMSGGVADFGPEPSFDNSDEIPF